MENILTSRNESVLHRNRFYGYTDEEFFLIRKIHLLISPRSPILSVPKCRQTVSTTLLRSSNFDKFCEFFNYRLEPAFQWETWKVPLSPSLVYNVRTILEDSDLRLSLIKSRILTWWQIVWNTWSFKNFTNSYEIRPMNLNSEEVVKIWNEIYCDSLCLCFYQFHSSSDSVWLSLKSLRNFILFVLTQPSLASPPATSNWTYPCYSHFWVKIIYFSKIKDWSIIIFDKQAKSDWLWNGTSAIRKQLFIKSKGIQVSFQYQSPKSLTINSVYLTFSILFKKNRFFMESYLNQFT